MKAKIDLEKFVRSLMEKYYKKIHIDPTTTKCWLDSVLEDQGLEYKDGEIVEIEQSSEKDYEDLLIVEGDNGVLLYFTKDSKDISDFRISKDTARWLYNKLGKYLEMYDEKPKESEEKEDSLEIKVVKEHMENLKKRIEDNQLGCIVQRLDKIIELLSWKPFPDITPYNPIIYKNPFYPDPNVPGGWTITASSNYDTNKIKQNETSKPES